MKNIQVLVDRIRETVQTHRLKNTGEYARWLWQDEEGSRRLGINEYGCADAANILYTINDFPRDPKVRHDFVKALQSMQDSETGLFCEETHHFIHTTAHCTAALELFDAAPLHKMKALDKYKNPVGLVELLENLDWYNEPWPQSHQGAGIYAALKLAGEIDNEWENTYFKWLWENADEKTGMWKKGTFGNGEAELFSYMGAAFHYMFNIEYAKMPLRYPERIIDTCLELYSEQKIGSSKHYYKSEGFGKYVGFLEIDWIFCITRSLRQCGYRRDDCISALRRFSSDYIDWLLSLDHKAHDGFNDLHLLFGTTCALAELQTSLPGEIRTDKPLRLVLDRRPFI